MFDALIIILMKQGINQRMFDVLIMILVKQRINKRSCKLLHRQSFLCLRCTLCVHH